MRNDVSRIPGFGHDTENTQQKSAPFYAYIPLLFKIFRRIYTLNYIDSC